MICNKLELGATNLINKPSLQKPNLENDFVVHIRNHEALLYKICRIYASTIVDRQDLFQEIIIQLWRAYPNYKGASKLSTWLYRVAINTAITGVRRKKNFIVSYEPEKVPEPYSEAHHSMAEEDRLQQLYTAIAQLSDIEKALVMLYLEERSYEEMEEILGLSGGTLRVKMNRIKEKLRYLTKK